MRNNETLAVAPYRDLIRRVKPSKCMLGDAAYDSAELREQLDERGTKPVTESTPIASRASGSTLGCPDPYWGSKHSMMVTRGLPFGP